jgi:hypothetical protein
MNRRDQGSSWREGEGGKRRESEAERERERGKGRQEPAAKKAQWSSEEERTEAKGDRRRTTIEHTTWFRARFRPRARKGTEGRRQHSRRRGVGHAAADWAQSHNSTTRQRANGEGNEQNRTDSKYLTDISIFPRPRSAPLLTCGLFQFQRDGCLTCTVGVFGQREAKEKRPRGKAE